MRLCKDFRADLRWRVLPGLCQRLSNVCWELGTTFPLSGLLESSGPLYEVLLCRPNRKEEWPDEPQFSVSCGLSQFLRCFTDLVMSSVSVLLCSNQWKGYWNHKLHQSHPPFIKHFTSSHSGLKHLGKRTYVGGGVWCQRKAFLTFNHLIFPIVKLLPHSHQDHHVAPALGIVLFNMKLSEISDTTLQFRSAPCWGNHLSQKVEGHQRRWPLMSPDNNHNSAPPRCCLLAAGTGPTAWTIWTGHGLFLHMRLRTINSTRGR